MSQKHSYLLVKKGTFLYGLAIRNQETYKEGEWAISLFRRKSTRDKAADKARSYMPVVKTFELDVAELAGLV